MLFAGAWWNVFVAFNCCEEEGYFSIYIHIYNLGQVFAYLV